jgi:hypothetical protein
MRIKLSCCQMMSGVPVCPDTHSTLRSPPPGNSQINAPLRSLSDLSTPIGKAATGAATASGAMAASVIAASVIAASAMAAGAGTAGEPRRLSAPPRLPLSIANHGMNWDRRARPTIAPG